MSYTISQILTSDTIGDSLSSINLNYSNLDQLVYNIQLSAQNFWIPATNIYNDINQQLQTYKSTIQSTIQNWSSMVTTIQMNSSKWIKPLVVFYPSVLSAKELDQNGNILQNSYNNVQNWLNIHYPIIGNETFKQTTFALSAIPKSIRSVNPLLSSLFLLSSNYQNPFYIENQNAYVYILTRNSENLNTVDSLKATGQCSVKGTQNTCIRCKTEFSGYVYCDNGNFTCDGNSFLCTQCKQLPCVFPQTSSSTFNPDFKIFLNVLYTDEYENKKISCIKFKVQNCQWQYISQL
jgi:hypothetical protein